MTHQEILNNIEKLSKEEQFALATTVLDRLSSQGPLPISAELKHEFLRREQEFDDRPDQGEPWKKVRTELFGQ